MKRKISYTRDFIETIDYLLMDEYNSLTERKDFLALLSKIEMMMSYDENETAWFENHNLREYFGRVSVPSSQFEGSSFPSSNRTINNNNDKDRVETVSVPIVDPSLPENSNLNHTGNTNEQLQKPKKKRVYKLDILLKKLEEKNIIYQTAYDRHSHKTRRYFFSSLFELECQNKELGIVKEDLPERYQKLLLKETSVPKEKHLRVQYDLLKSQRFQIDLESAIQWIDDQYQKNLITFNQKRAYLRAALSLEDKLIFTVEGAKGGRVFTNFNSIKRELRQFCTIDGQRLMSVDLKSSQPYLMAQHMNRQWPKESRSFYDTVTKDDIYIFFLKKWNEANPSGFYREFNLLKNKMEDIYLNTRDDIKPEYLKLMFKVRGRKPALDDVFKAEFPFVYEKVQEQKEELAAQLQREESDLFIPICTEFADLGCLSVHDSLAFKPELKSIILNRLSQRFAYKGYKDFVLKED